MTPILELKKATKTFGEGAAKTEVLGGIDLAIEDGEFVAIVGFSGSGKTTLINLIAGLEQVDAGEVLLKGKPIDGPGPDRGLVFQSYSLFPWLTVMENIKLAIESVFPKLNKEETRTKAQHYIDMVGLSHAVERRPAELSGGMRQRVSVARALAMNPDILLLDEPLSALDALTRSKLQDEIEQIWEQDKKTVILITNDVDEAILLADRIIPLNPGPNATLGPDFKVNLARPRDRASMNSAPEFKRLRADVTKYLMDVGAAAQEAAGDNGELPNVTPVFPENKRPPKAFREAMASNNEDRYLEFFNLTKVYPTPKGPLTVVDGFETILKKGDFISLIGHSGCGKSTVLSMAAGLNPISDGGIVLDGKEVNGANPERAVVFQAPNLFTWLTAKENVMLGVDRVFPHASQAERNDIVEYYLSRVGLKDAMDKPTADMSNGMKQRVGIARAFALSPKLLLLDEPFGMLDSLTRWELQEVLMEVWDRTKVTTVCVTHDVDEAILLADRVVMMTNGPHARIGKVMEVDLPRPRSRKALLEHPRYYDLRAQLLGFLEEYEHGHQSKAELETQDDTDEDAPVEKAVA